MGESEDYGYKIGNTSYTIEKIPGRKNYCLLRTESRPETCEELTVSAWFTSDEAAMEFKRFYHRVGKAVIVLEGGPS